MTEITTLGELSFVGTDVVVVAVVKAGLARSSSDSWTARGATDVDSTLLFSFSSSIMMTAPGTLSVIFDDGCIVAFSICGVRVTDDLYNDTHVSKQSYVTGKLLLRNRHTVFW